MTTVESAWATYPDYVIDVEPWPGVARAWYGDVLLAESTNALRVKGERHVDRLYFPEADVRWEHFTATDHHTVCPFKGEADYWSLTAAEPSLDNVVWAYRTPFPQVGGIEGHVCFYESRLRVELLDHWPGDPTDRAVSTQFPEWGSAGDLLRLLEVAPLEGQPGRFASPPSPTERNVVEGGHQLAQGVIAAAKTVPGQRVVSAHMIFSKAASFDQPLDVVAEVLRPTRTPCERRRHHVSGSRTLPVDEQATQGDRGRGRTPARG